MAAPMHHFSATLSSTPPIHATEVNARQRDLARIMYAASSPSISIANRVTRHRSSRPNIIPSDGKLLLPNQATTKLLYDCRAAGAIMDAYFMIVAWAVLAMFVIAH